MSREKQIEEMGKLCPFYEEGKCNLLDGARCDFDCDMCDFAETLYNAGYRKQEWISVDERLPEDYGDVICHTRKGSIWQLTYNPKYRLFNVSCDNVEDAMDVDYWMPLPEPPKMKGGAE